MKRGIFYIISRSRSEMTALANPPPIKVFGVEGRYVSALYSAAHQMKQLDEVEKHLKDLEKSLVKPKILDFIVSSLMSNTEKAKLLKEISTEVGMPQAAVNFLEIVALNGRLKMLKKMIAQFLKVMVAHRNESQCEVITAKPLDETSRKALMEVLKRYVHKDKKVQITEIIDPAIIGGMIVGIEDKHIDLSIARKVQFYTNLMKQSV